MTLQCVCRDPHQHGRLVGQDISEDISGDHDVELLGPADELHRRVVHVLVRQLHLRVLVVHLDHHIPPQLILNCINTNNRTISVNTDAFLNFRASHA